MQIYVKYYRSAHRSVFLTYVIRGVPWPMRDFVAEVHRSAVRRKP